MNIFRKHLNAIFVLACMFLVNCGGGSDDPKPSNGDTDLTDLPADTGGVHEPHVLGSTDAALGYYVYLPGGYTSNSKTYPLLIVLHGKSERGDGTDDPAILDKVLVNGPPKLIKNGTWDPTYPMIVVTPQFHGTDGNDNNWGGGDPAFLKSFIEFMLAKYRVNNTRIYLTGLSHGGNGVYDYISLTSDASNYIAAAVPVAAYGATKGYSNCKNTPIWAFVGEDDATNFATSKAFITKYNEQVPAPAHKALFTGFVGVGHDVWTKTYSGAGIGTGDPDYDAFDQSVYDWMFQYKRAN
jgi:predicted peptidase